MEATTLVNTTLVNTRDGSEDLPAEMGSLVVSRPEPETQVVAGASSALTVVCANPDCELVACKTWEELNLKPGLLKALYETMKFQKPAKIQEVALPLGLKDPAENGIFQAKSGQGKTCAFSLIMLMRVNEALKHTQAVCVAPTYELALQSARVCRKMGEGIGVSVLLATSDKRSCPKFKKGEKCTDQIVIGTPGKINALLKSKVIDGKKVGVFVLDEADEMVKESGHSKDTQTIKKFMPQAQALLFSASYEGNTYELSKTLCKRKDKQGKPMRFNEIRIADVKDVLIDEIAQFYIKTGGSSNEDETKMEALASIYGSLSVGQSIIFVERKATADKLQLFMEGKSLACAKLHGGVDIELREKLFTEFVEGKRSVLIATNVLARGVDVPGMSLVVNYDFPVNRDGTPAFDTYQHRIGRCGRFGRKGCAITFVHSAKDQELLDETADHFGCTVTEADADDPEELVELVKKAQDQAPASAS